MTVDPEVEKIIKEFVERQQSFISLDVYCKLGIHFDDSENPIHEQVRSAYGTDLMSNYLCKWVKLRLEGGGFAHCWKYYLPKAQVQAFDLRVRSDGRAELSKRVLGSFALLECDLGCVIEDGKIRYELASDDKDYVVIVNASNRIIITASMAKRAGLENQAILKGVVYPNKIEIVSSENKGDVAKLVLLESPT